MRSPVRVLLDLARHPMPVLSIALAGVFALVQVGCGSHSAPVPISGVEILEHTPTIAVDVENIRGAVLLRVNNKLTAPRIVANAGTLTGEPVENFQGGKWVTAQFTETDGRAVLTVRNTPQENQSERWVQVAIEVPSCDGVRVKNSDGAIDIRGANGTITVENGGAGRPGGYIYVATGKPATSPISLTTANGDIDLILPTDSTGNIELTSANGRLAAIVAWTGQVNNSVIKPGQYSGLLNWGTNPIRAKTGEGEVRLHVGPYRFGNPHIRYYNSWWFSMLDRAGTGPRPA